MHLPVYTPLVRKDQLRYYAVTRCKYYIIVEKHNNRVIMYFIRKVTDEEEYVSVQKIVVVSFVNNTTQNIQFGSIGAIDADDKHSHGYYMVEFSSYLYALK